MQHKENEEQSYEATKDDKRILNSDENVNTNGEEWDDDEILDYQNPGEWTDPKSSPKITIRQQLVSYPLTEAHLKMIYDEIERNGIKNKATVIADINSELDQSHTYKTLYENLCLKMSNYFGQNTKKFVGKLMLFKKKMCRNGDGCARKDTCIFIHPVETQFDDTKLEPRKCNNENLAKKRKVENNDEVVLNKVPEELADIKSIEEYCGRFGPIKLVRQLKPGKFLIKFKDPRSASDLIYANELVMDDQRIMKFFNLYARGTAEPEIDVNAVLEILSEKDRLIDQLYKKGERQIASQLRSLTTKLRDYISKINEKNSH